TVRPQTSEADPGTISPRSDCRDPRSDECDVGRARLEAEREIVGSARTRAAKRMTLRKAHRTGSCRGARCRADELGELDCLPHAFRRAQVPHGNARIFSGEQPLRDLARGRRIDSRNGPGPESGNGELASIP